MHAMRRELTDARGDETPVGHVADRNSFPQHGRFLIYDRALFGESPSETRHRWCQRPAAE
jgi:hypothetical protein